MLRTILIIFLIYLIYRFIKFFLKNIIMTYRAGGTNHNQNTYSNRQSSNSKYRNIEEAEFTEIKTEPRKPEQEEREDNI